MNSIILAIQDGGIWMAPIIISFVFALAIMGERLFVIMGARSNKKTLLANVKSALIAGNIVKASQQCGGNQPLPKVLKAGLSKAGRPDKEMESAFDQAIMEEFPVLTKRMAFLPMLANVATLSGLLGTIIGLIEAFDAVASAAPDQKQIMLAKGISKAMYTTAGGLVVAIPTLVGNALLLAVVTGIMDDVDSGAASVLNEYRATRGTEAAK
jgi:biopolymer transport protein ExbB/TolQ